MAHAEPTGQGQPTSPIIALEYSLHFFTMSGEDRVVEAGTYRLQPDDEAVLLIANDKTNTTSSRLAATKFSHDVEIVTTFAYILPATDPDRYQLFVLLPEKQGWLLLGSRSGTHPRGGPSDGEWTSRMRVKACQELAVQGMSEVCTRL